MMFNLFELFKEAKRFSLSLNRSIRANPVLNGMKDLGVSQQLVEKGEFHATDFLEFSHFKKRENSAEINFGANTVRNSH